MFTLGRGSFIIVLLCISYSVFCQEESRDTKQHPELSTLVRNWAQKLGGELWHFGELVTRRTKAIESFKDTTIVKEDGEALLKDIYEKISNMMKEKVEAVKRIMDIAEQAAKAQKEDDIDRNFQYYDAKNLTNSAPNITMSDQEDTGQTEAGNMQEVRYVDDSFISPNSDYRGSFQQDMGYQQDQEPTSVEENSKDDEESLNAEIEVTDDSEKDPLASQTPPNDKTKLPLYHNRHFYNIPVNTNYSAVHVPSNVYARSEDVISGIIWSEELDKTFRYNYKIDPTLSWQYFGSSTGFMRQFPAMIWSQEPVDLFDCRTRSWFIEAASSPKDVVILVDRSGSMTGMRREIARHVVYNILDTLGNNDYVNIYTFSNTTEPLVECFDNMLVQANLGNVRLLKESMENFKTEQIANFSLAFMSAFELLKEYRENKKGACCNQAIMLVTDGVQYNYKEIFEKYNWQNLPFMNVRVFTYLIGREVSDVREVKWMACANQGYYVHLSTYAEVREEVLKYIPVMARPMVLNPSQKPNPTWSPVYADVTDPKLTNWLWVTRERNRQRERFLAYRRNKTLLAPDEQDKKFVHQQKYLQDNYGDLQVYHLMTSVSLPVYDKKPRKERVANLLGVAGTDVPIEYILRLMLPYRLGVNGYAFIVTNNGYILIHPDLRPVYQGILKPAYNRVDVVEVEIVDDDSEPREFSDEIIELRRRIVMQKSGNISLPVKTHFDDMRRIIMSRRHYFYMGINDTPFSLVVALPHRYGFNRVQHPVENDIHRIRSNDKIKGSLTQFFTGNWTIHPDWHYCRYLGDNRLFENPEEEFIHFLQKMEGPGWKWSQECDRKLICKVVADAKITAWFSQNITQTTKEENGPEFIKRFGITVAFLATHSGLTRWQSFPQNVDPLLEQPHFHILHNRAIDEIWYKRAVEHHYTDSRNFVYSVPFDIGEDNNTLVTVSHAIFKEEGTRKAPAAVVGYQFYHHAFHNFFKKITTSCGDKPCKRTCESNELHCLLLDDNGYVIVSDNLAETGFFFGKIRPDIMSALLEEGIYKVTRMYDYQALCPESRETSNPASRSLTPLTHIWQVLGWFFTTFQYLFSFLIPIAADEELLRLFHMSIEKYSKTAPCDHEIYLYTLNYSVLSTFNEAFFEREIDDSYLFLYPIEKSSLLFVVITSEHLSDNASQIDEYDIKQSEFTTLYYNDLPLECVVETKHQTFYRKYFNVCFNKEEINPLVQLTKLFNWVLGTLLSLLRAVVGNEFETLVYPDNENYDSMHEEEHEMEMETADQPVSKVNEKEFDQRLIITKTTPETCDHELWLYNLVHYTERNISNSGYNKTMTNCNRPFIVQRVSGSNMILLVINNLCIENLDNEGLSPDSTKVDYNMTLACYRVLQNDLPRRHYMSCINRNANESEIKLCGRGASTSLSRILLVIFIFRILL